MELSEYYLGQVDGTVPQSNGKARKHIDVVSPRDNTLLGHVPEVGAEEIGKILLIAKKAQKDWASLSALERSSVLLKCASSVEENSRKIATLLSLENGNCLESEALRELQGAISTIRYFAGVASEVAGPTKRLREGFLDVVIREPHGVVAAIVPWNNPVMLSALKIAPALAAGNSIVIKVSSEAPFAALEFCRTMQDHLPLGVLTILTGSGSRTGTALTKHDSIDKISFTGSTEVGLELAKSAVRRMLPISMELGGKNAQVVFPDIDNFDSTVKGIVEAMRFSRQGQSCTSGSRLFVHRDLLKHGFIERLVQEIESLEVGDPLSPLSQVGAVVSKVHFNRVWRYIDAAIDSGSYRVLTGANRYEGGLLAKGFYIPMTLFQYLESGPDPLESEIFGPVMSLRIWDDYSQLVSAINHDSYALAGFIWTSRIENALNTVRDMEAGWIQVNNGGGQVLGQSYGGHKMSGMGSEFSLESMLDAYTKSKQISMRF